MKAMRNSIRRFRRGKCGQAIVEYAILLAVFAAVLLAVIPSFQDSVGTAYINSESKVTDIEASPTPEIPVPTGPIPTAEYTVIYNANGGVNAPPVQYKRQGVNLTLSSDTPTKSNSVFVGWSRSQARANSQAVDFNPGDVYTEDADLILYASWTANDVSYQLRYYVNSPAGASAYFESDSSPITRTKHNNVAATIITNVPICEGYEFLGWNESRTSSVATYQGGDLFYDNRSADFYAIWAPAEYTVKYHANGGTGTVPNEASYSTGTTVTVQSALLTMTNRQFVGWSTASNSASVEYPVGSTFIMPNHDVDLYAVYMRTEYPYNGSNGTDGSIQSFTAPVTGSYQISLWGAKGGASCKDGVSNNSGAGGYTTVTVNLERGQTIYFAVGGHGADNNFSRSTSAAAANPGGWNGGGNGYTDAAVDEGGNFSSSEREGSGGGGGATSAYVSYRGDGQLTNYSNNRSDILGVAGGSSGANYTGSNGYGGGASGGNSPYCGTQSSGYAFGRGESATGSRRIF